MQNVLTKLVTLSSLASSKVFRSRASAGTRAESPYLVLRKASEDDPETVNVAQRRIVFSVDIYARGENAESDMDPIEAEVHKKLMADRTLGGNCILLNPMETTWESEDADQTAHKCSMKFSALYRCQPEDLSISG